MKKGILKVCLTVLMAFAVAITILPIGKVKATTTTEERPVLMYQTFINGGWLPGVEAANDEFSAQTAGTTGVATPITDFSICTKGLSGVTITYEKHFRDYGWGGIHRSYEGESMTGPLR